MLKRLWDEQSGICPITGWSMEKRKTGSGLTARTVTVDRVDQTIGYIENNIRLVCFAANNARYVWSDYDLVLFCKAVIKTNGNTHDCCEDQSQQ